MNLCKPCPFCGSNEQTIKTVWGNWRFVACKCKAAGAPGKNDFDAVDNWNKRVDKAEKKSEFCFNAYPDEYAEASNGFKCSECGYECDGEMLWKCPGCGRSIL